MNTLNKILNNSGRTGTISVHPKNWKSKDASIKTDWYISYRFYPLEGKPTQKIIRGMNQFKTLSERRQATQTLLDNEIQMLKQGYNPSLNRFVKDSIHNIDPYTPFIQALKNALVRIKGVKGTLDDMKGVVNGVEKSAKVLYLDTIPIKEVSRRNLKLILEHRQKENPRFSAHRYNLYRAYLMRLFKELVELEAIEFNPVRDISKQKEVRTIKEVITTEDLKRIAKELEKTNPRFLLFLRCFHYSGGRITEICNLKASDVDLENQTYRSLIKKGRYYEEVDRPIPDVAVPYFTEISFRTFTEPNYYLFSKNLLPGPKPIRPDQMGRRWVKYVMKPLEIKATLYRLKHTRLDKIEAELSIEEASKQAGHKGTVITMRYTPGAKGRKDEKLKGVGGDL